MTTLTRTLEHLPIPATDLDRIRCNGHDDHGNAVVPRPSEAGSPLRCCLRLSGTGESIALIAYQPSPLGAAYAEVGPVFIHAGQCPGYPDTATFPADYRHRQAVLRPYDATGQMLAGVLAEPGESERDLERLFGDPRVALVHVRNVIAGCWNFSVRRAE